MLALRKGPDAIPSSSLVLTLSIVMLLGSSVFAALSIETMRSQNHLLTFSGYALGLLFYGGVLFVSGYAGRMLQTLSAIVACGALITTMYVVAFLLLEPLFGRELAGIAGLLILFWSVPVEGHIIARAIQQHRLVGITIAVVAIILQLGFQSAFAVHA
jgi:hypothetical protein